MPVVGSDRGPAFSVATNIFERTVNETNDFVIQVFYLTGFSHVKPPLIRHVSQEC